MKHPDSNAWRPGADKEILRLRSELLAVLRAFFAERDVMEVVTPVLGGSGVTDVHIENVPVDHGGRRYYLQTSPEYAMKRLLADGSGPVYQICQAFRGGETGRRHNIEFTMLEWYRPGFDLDNLMSEVEDLVRRAASIVAVDLPPFECIRYKDLFLTAYGENPHLLDDQALRELVAANDVIEASHMDENTSRNDCLDLLFSTKIEKELIKPMMVRDYPECQAALATTSLDDEKCRVADRFELFIGGMEFANGYDELRDSSELAARMMANNDQRQRRGLPAVPADEKLLSAVGNMPPCAGVALGVDRLLMWMAGRDRIDEVLSFSDSRL